MSLALPYVLANRYRLTARIGEGSFSETYLATDTSLERQVAVKILREHYARDRAFRRPLRARGACRGGRRASERGRHLRLRTGWRHALHHHGMGRWQRSQASDPGTSPLPVARSDPSYPRDPARTRGNSPGRDHPSRREAAKCSPVERRPSQAERFRHRAWQCRFGSDRHWHGAWHRRLYGAGAGQRRERHQCGRSLFSGGDSVRDAHRTSFHSRATIRSR